MRRVALLLLCACAAPRYGDIEGDFTGPDAVGMALVGRWVSEDDPRATLDIDLGPDGQVAAMGYDGRLGAPEPLDFVTDCEARAPADASSGAFTIGRGDPLCYALLVLTPDRLVLSNAPRGNTLRYRRAD